MILGITTLLIAILISAVSAYYSILGLTAIFAAAVMPVIIMGVALEAGKVMTAIWLHRNWYRAGFLYKVYLTPAILFLMLLTSMGVFGFLSKAHIEQGVPIGDIQAQIQIIDEKISSQRENIQVARQTLEQLNSTVNETIKRSNTERGVANADWMRKTQAKERTNLNNQIEQAQKTILKLQEEKAPLAAQARKVDAEVGPIKYVAALIYGDTADVNMLERAVRLVILLIVIVFDPLAIVLIIAGLKQIQWSLEERSANKKIAEKVSDAKSAVDQKPEYDANHLVFSGLDGNSIYVYPSWQSVKSENTTTNETQEKTSAETTQETNSVEVVEHETLNKNLEQPETDEKTHSENDEVLIPESQQQNLEKALAEIYQQHNDLDLEYKAVLQKNSKLETAVFDLRQKIDELENTVPDTSQAETVISVLQLEKEQLAEEIIKIQTERDLLFTAHSQETQRANQLALELEKLMAQLELSNLNTEQTTSTSNESEEIDVVGPAHTDFGTEFPAAPNRADMFMRVDFKPARLFKWNGLKWIEVNKSSTDAFSYNSEYIQYLADKLANGEYLPEDLTDSELEQIQQLSGR